MYIHTHTHPPRTHIHTAGSDHDVWYTPSGEDVSHPSGQVFPHTCQEYLLSGPQAYPPSCSPVVFSSSPISIQNYGFTSLGSCVTGPPPLVQDPRLQRASIVSPSIHSSTRYPLTPRQPMNQIRPLVTSQQAMNLSSSFNQSRPLVETPFWVCFVRGNISRCNG